MRAITIKGSILPCYEARATDFTGIGTLGLTWIEIQSFSDQRRELLSRGVELDEIEAIIELDGNLGTLFGHTIKIKAKEVL
jgi:hypothetical protein